VDLYHARKHLHALGALLALTLGDDHQGWLAERLADLDRGDVPTLLAAARALTLPNATTRELDALRPLPRARPLRRVRRWSVRGAAGVITLRCQEASGRWEEVWTGLRNQTSVA